jgi:ABC-type histidine transport system ATPase subunit
LGVPSEKKQMASLAISDVTKRFGSVEVLKGIDISIASGKFLVVDTTRAILFDPQTDQQLQ